MNLKNKLYIPEKAQLLKFTVALVMCGCLLLLTGVNFFIYGAGANNISITLPMADDNAPDENTPEKPVEEKSSTTSVNIQEDYLHECDLLHNMAAIGNSLKYSLPGTANLATVHFKLISPPPDL